MIGKNNGGVAKLKKKIKVTTAFLILHSTVHQEVF